SSSEVQKLRPTPSNVSVEADNALPPVIEVYKRPRVEIYRRRPSGQFERD
ncbi:MAG TPA: ABC transporter ATP-binding protein, partial [Rhodobacteraceae bacterium]|nr:ABC transporter ATP-binding protein [Paracoccaceae bacterium]